MHRQGVLCSAALLCALSLKVKIDVQHVCVQHIISNPEKAVHCIQFAGIMHVLHFIPPDQCTRGKGRADC